MQQRTADCCPLNFTPLHTFFRQRRRLACLQTVNFITVFMPLVHCVIYFLNECMFRFNLTQNAFAHDTRLACGIFTV